MSIKLPNAEKRTKINVARLSKILNKACVDIGTGDASHLCHNSLCVNSSHINIEPRTINNQRKICVSINKCIGHTDNPECLLHLKL